MNKYLRLNDRLKTELENIISKIKTANNFNEMGGRAMKLNKIKMAENKRRELFYKIDFPFNAKAEFIDGNIQYSGISA